MAQEASAHLFSQLIYQVVSAGLVLGREKKAGVLRASAAGWATTSRWKASGG